MKHSVTTHPFLNKVTYTSAKNGFTQLAQNPGSPNCDLLDLEAGAARLSISLPGSRSFEPNAYLRNQVVFKQIGNAEINSELFRRT